MEYKNEYSEDNQNEQNIQNNTWQDDSSKESESGNNVYSEESENEPQKKEKIPQLTSDEKQELQEWRNSEEMKQGLKDILPSDNNSDSEYSREQPSNLSKVIKQWQSENKSEETESKNTENNENQTGVPDELKAKIETQTGVSLDSVKVIYNSSLPEKHKALAFSKGDEVHIGPGQEEHLAHELMHFVQKLKGQVKKTGESNGEAINDDPVLENEADSLGAKAENMNTEDLKAPEKEIKAPLEDSMQMMVMQKVDEDTAAEEEAGSGGYLQGLISAGKSTVEILEEAWNDGAQYVDEVTDGLEISKLTEALPSVPDVLQYLLDKLWPSGTGWELALAGNANGTICGTDAGFPADVELGADASLDLSVMRNGSIVEFSVKSTESGNVAGVPSIKVAELPIDVKIENCLGFKLAVDVGQIDFPDNLFSLLKSGNIKDAFKEIIETQVSLGANTQLEVTAGGSADASVSGELGAESAAKLVADAGIKAGLEVTFANPTETMDGKAEFKGEVGAHGHAGYELAGGNDSDPVYIESLIAALDKIKEGGVDVDGAVGMRVTVGFPSGNNGGGANFEVALFAKGGAGLSLLGSEVKLSGEQEIVLAMPDIPGFVNAISSPEGVTADSVAGLIPFSKINTTITGEFTLASLFGIIPSLVDMIPGFDDFDKVSAKAELKMVTTKEALTEIAVESSEKIPEIVNLLLAGKGSEAFTVLLDFYSERAADIISWIESLKLELKSTHEESGTISTPLEGDVTGVSASGSVALSDVSTYEFTPEQLGLNHLENFLRNIVASN